MTLLKKILVGACALVGVVVAGGGIFVWTQVSAFNSSVAKVYDLPVPSVTLSSDPAVLERGKHLADAVVPCTGSDCHGKDLAGGKIAELGPLGRLTGPNVTSAGLGAAYTDGELVRLIQYGIKKDGTSVRFMPVQDWSWLPLSDIVAAVSYVRTMPPVQKPNGPFELGVLAKILDRQEVFPIDIARRIDNAKVGKGPAPSPTKEYGSYLIGLCSGCHGPRLSGGPIPGAPPELPPPSNLTPHATGLAGWTYEDFDNLLTKGIRKSGKKLDPFMPIESFGKLDDVEKHALFAFMQTLPPIEFGNR
jgi:hypothetical protein